MVVIKKRSNVIPVDFGEFQLNFPVSDGNIQRMKAVGEDLQAKGQAFQETTDEEALGALKTLVEDGFNQVFDDKEAFNQVYAFAGQSTINAMFYLIEAIKGISEEFENQNSKAALINIWMLDLSRKLTDKLVIDDKEYALDLSFDNVLKMFEMMRDDDIPEYIKPHFAIRMLISKSLAGNTREEKAESFNNDFENYSIEEMSKVFKSVFEEHISLSDVEDNHVEYDLAGNPMKTTASSGKQEQAPYDIRFDGDYIYSSFLQAYGIDLFDVQGQLHWRKFNALLSGLPEGTKLMEVIKIRKWKPQKGDSSEYKEEMRRLQKDYALPYEVIEEEEYEEEF